MEHLKVNINPFFLTKRESFRLHTNVEVHQGKVKEIDFIVFLSDHSIILEK